MKRSVLMGVTFTGVLLGVIGALMLWLPLYENWQTSLTTLAERKTRLAMLNNTQLTQPAKITASAVYRAPIQTLLMQAQTSGVVVSAVDVPDTTNGSLGTQVTGEASLPAFESWLAHSEKWQFKRLTLTSLKNGRLAFQFYAAPGAVQSDAGSSMPAFMNPFCEQLGLSEAEAAAATPYRLRVSWRALHFAGSAKRGAAVFGLLMMPQGSLITVQVGDVLGLEQVRVSAVTEQGVRVVDAHHRDSVIGVEHA